MPFLTPIYHKHRVQVKNIDNNENRVSAFNKIYVLATAETESENALQWKWSVKGKGSILDSRLEDIIVGSRYQPNLIIRANALGSNQSITLLVEATDDQGTGRT